jgi:hypothetical protein
MTPDLEGSGPWARDSDKISFFGLEVQVRSFWQFLLADVHSVLSGLQRRFTDERMNHRIGSHSPGLRHLACNLPRQVRLKRQWFNGATCRMPEFSSNIPASLAW